MKVLKFTNFLFCKEVSNDYIHMVFLVFLGKRLSHLNRIWLFMESVLHLRLFCLIRTFIGYSFLSLLWISHINQYHWRGSFAFWLGYHIFFFSLGIFVQSFTFLEENSNINSINKYVMLLLNNINSANSSTPI